MLAHRGREAVVPLGPRPITARAQNGGHSEERGSEQPHPAAPGEKSHSNLQMVWREDAAHGRRVVAQISRIRWRGNGRVAGSRVNARDVSDASASSHRRDWDVTGISNGKSVSI